MSSTMTHPNSKFSPFSLPLSNGGNLSGIYYLPKPSLSTDQYRPLMILLHGGGCTAHHYDVDETHTAGITAEALSIPVVSINRPSYKETSTLAGAKTFHQETGEWEHEYIFPALWKTFGPSNHCTAIVVLGHSMATPGMIVAASLYAQDPSPKYPLAGIIFSGWGTAPNLESQKERLTWTRVDQLLQYRSRLMLGDSSLKCAPEYISKYFPYQTVKSPPKEAPEVVSGHWETYWRPLAAEIQVPIMYAIGEHDWLWYASQEYVKDLEKCFPKCPRFDGSVVLGAPHAIEWSHYAQGWYTRCFGFALEVTAHYGVHPGKGKS